MKNGLDLLARIEELAPELAAELRDYLGEDVAQSESSEFDLAENMTEIGSSAPILFREVGGENSGGEITYEAVDDVGARLLEQFDFIDKPTGLNIPTARNSVYESIEREGQDPYYVVWQMPSGYSRFMSQDGFNRPDAIPKKENRHRFWPPEVIHDFAEQIDKRHPVGYLGHADFWSMSSLPENIPVQWERAVRATRKSDGVAVTLARGYVYDTGMNRAHLKTGAIDSASVFTVGTNELDTTDKGTEANPVIHVKSAALISFDFVRKHNHGIPRTKMVQDISHKEQHVRTAEERAIIAGATAEEIRTLNPTVVTVLESANHADGNLVSELRGQLSESIRKGLTFEISAATLSHVAEQCGCEESAVLETVTNLLNSHRDAIKEAIDVHVSTLKGEALRETIRTRLAERKFAKPSDVKVAFDAEKSAMHDISKLMAQEHNLGAVSGNDESASSEGLVATEWSL